MLTSIHIQSMRDELIKIATRSTQGEHEEMNRARFKQMMKDLPIVVGGTALGYGVGKTVGEVVGDKLLESSVGRERLRKFGPIAGSLLSSAGAYALGQQRAIMKERRDDADMEANRQKRRGG